MEQASAAGGGWAVDQLHVFYQPDIGQPALVPRTEWESPSEAQEFAAAFRLQEVGRFSTTLREEDGRLVWTGETLAGKFTWNGEATLWSMPPQAHLLAARSEELGW